MRILRLFVFCMLSVYCIINAYSGFPFGSMYDSINPYIPMIIFYISYIIEMTFYIMVLYLTGRYYLLRD